jgi:hypothetical protein
VAAAIAVVAVAVIVGTWGGQDTTTPANPPTTVEPSEETRGGRRHGFLQCVQLLQRGSGGLHAGRDADLSGFGVDGTREFRLLMRFWEATGFKHMLDSCEETGRFAFGTVVRCTWNFHAIRSDEIGLGPYSGSYDELTVRDGEIVDVFGEIGITAFSRESWEPFAEWVSTNYPEDVAVMYKSDFSDYQLTPESIRLWEQHTREYVEAVQRGTA